MIPLRVAVPVCVVALATVSRAQTGDLGPVAVGACVGPHVQTVIQGDYRRGIPDRAIGDTPPIYARPGGGKVGELTVWTAYTVDRVHGGYALLRGTHASKPFAAGQSVGWVRASALHALALRNCV